MIFTKNLLATGSWEMFGFAMAAAVPGLLAASPPAAPRSTRRGPVPFVLGLSLVPTAEERGLGGE